MPLGVWWGWLGWSFVLLWAAAATPGCSRASGDAERAAVQPRPATVPGEWPRWRGPNVDGISDETAWNAEWDDPPPVVWLKNIGIGFSSFAVQDSRLYTMGHVDDDDVVYCLDAATGKEIWKHSYPCRLVDWLHEGGPAATPTLDEGRVYTVSKEGHFFCLGGENGDVIWQRRFKDDLGVPMPDWGFACSPLIWRDLVIVDGGCTAAYSKTSGELVWKTEKYLPGYGSPIHFRHQGEDRIAVLNNDGLLVVRAKDGSEVAKTKWKTHHATNSTTPIVSGDTLFISTGYAAGCGLFRLEGGELRSIYENKNMRNHFNNCVLWQGHLYGFDGNTRPPRSRLVTLTCLDYETGETRWKEPGLGCGSLMMANERLIILSEQGELVIAEASPEEFRPLSRAKILDGRCWTAPVLAGGLIYARNAAGDVVCVDLRR